MLNLCSLAQFGWEISKEQSILMAGKETYAVIRAMRGLKPPPPQVFPRKFSSPITTMKQDFFSETKVYGLSTSLFKNFLPIFVHEKGEKLANFLLLFDIRN